MLNKKTNLKTLVQANSRNNAIRRVTEEDYSALPASATELLEFMKSGGTVLEATIDEATATIQLEEGGNV